MARIKPVDAYTWVRTAASKDAARPSLTGMEVSENGRVAEDTQTAYAVALQFDLLPENLRVVAAKRLAQEVRTRGHLTTGFVGTPYLCHVLSRYGYLDDTVVRPPQG